MMIIYLAVRTNWLLQLWNIASIYHGWVFSQYVIYHPGALLVKLFVIVVYMYNVAKLSPAPASAGLRFALFPFDPPTHPTGIVV